MPIRPPPPPPRAARSTAGRRRHRHLRRTLGAPVDGGAAHRADSLDTALAETRGYLDRIVVADGNSEVMEDIASMFHILDHLGRLLYRCQQSARIAELPNDRRLRRLTGVLVAATDRYAAPGDPAACEARLDRTRAFLRRQRTIQRRRMIADTASGAIADDVVWQRLDALRWLQRVAYHLWRIRWHLNVLHEAGRPATTAAAEARIEVAQD